MSIEERWNNGGCSDVSDCSVDAHEQAVLHQHFWEYERSVNTVRVKGRLANKVEFWEQVVQAPAYIVDVVKYGYVMPFHSEPTEFFRLNQVCFGKWGIR